MLNKKYKVVPTPPYEHISCHPELVSGSIQRKIFEILKRVQNDKNFSFKPAFTLAEVLITLVIIGVIAAITVPTLLTKYQKEQTVTKLKKAYSTLAQTTNRAIADYGPIITWELGTANDPVAAKAFFDKYLVPYLQITGEVKPYSEFEPMKIYKLSGDEITNMEYYSKFYLNDGTAIIGKVIRNSSTQKDMFLFVDINGDKKPNKQGKDIFQYYYRILSSNTSMNGKFFPTGYTYTREEILSPGDTHCHKEGSGAWCSALIAIDGWQIADDYPW